VYLITHGVWIRKTAGTSFAKVLQDCLDEETRHEWTKEEIEDHLKLHSGDFDSQWNPTNDRPRALSQTPSTQPVYLSNQQPKNTSLSSTSSLSSRVTCHDPSIRPRTTSRFCKSSYFRLHQNRTLSAKAHPFSSKFKICQRILLLLQTLRKPLQSNQLF
jgi:hypothetical protein